MTVDQIRLDAGYVCLARKPITIDKLRLVVYYIHNNNYVNNAADNIVVRVF